jgi:putative toxin-antitoxin system antitoxin component (TIGR02293 family)
MAGKTTTRTPAGRTRARKFVAAGAAGGEQAGSVIRSGRFVPDAGPEGAASLDKWFKRVGYARGAGGTLATELRVAQQVRKGYPAQAVDEILAAGMIEPRIMYEIVVPRRTLAHRKQKEQPLTPEQSDRLARVLRIFARAQEALGDLDRASRWLHKENRALQGRRPVELLGSDAGTRAVEKVLGRIEHGVFS